VSLSCLSWRIIGVRLRSRHITPDERRTFLNRSMYSREQRREILGVPCSNSPEVRLLVVDNSAVIAFAVLPKCAVLAAAQV
jgi:hypothetical protein